MLLLPCSVHSADGVDNKSQVGKLQQQLTATYYSSKRVSEQKCRQENEDGVKKQTAHFPFFTFSHPTQEESDIAH